MKKSFFGLFFIFIATHLIASENLPRFDYAAKFREANQLMEEKLWTQSINNWKEILEQDPNNANVNYKVGYCYLQTANSKLDALQYLEAACSRKFSKNYDEFDPAEKRAPLQALFYLGKAQALNMQLDAAIESFEKLQKALGKKHMMYADATRELERAQEAKTQMANPRNYIITNVGIVINGETNEYSPVLSLDESTMFFTSRRLRADSSNSNLRDLDTGEFKEDVFVSFKNEEGVWTEPEVLNLNSNEHDATISVSPDGQRLFIYKDNRGDGQLLESALIGETWSEPMLLGSDINTAAWETHATVSADGNTLYFVSDREGGIGKRDIYRCVKLPNGEWSRALNAGTQINTIYDEDAPFLTADGKTLYFASRGHANMGGFDIFYSKLGEDGEWGTPVNMGYPLNTVDDDVFFVPMADGRRAYYSSSKDGGYGLKDIYLVDMPEINNETQLAVLKGFIISAEGEELPDDLRILVTNNKSGEVSEYRPRKRDGGYLAILNPCTSYHIEYYKGKEVIKEDDINVPCETAFQEIEREVFLVPVTMTKEEPKKEEKPVVELPKEEKPEIVEEPAIDVTPPGETLDIKEFAYNSKDPINRQYIPEKGFAQYSRYFVYDFHEFGVTEPEFALFIRDVDAIIKSGKKPVINVEASASKVPSSRFKNNEELVANRHKTAHDQIRDELAKYKRVEGKDYTFGDGQKLVQGKEYANDAKKNRLIYEQFQYIKVRVQG
jgi:Tol biopolymer transport system component